MRADGVRLLAEGSERTARLRCTQDPSELGPQDWLIIALKAHSIAEAVESMVPLLGPRTNVVTTSNGLPYWFFAGTAHDYPLTRLAGIDPDGKQLAILGHARAVGCVTLPATEVIAPGVIR